MSNRRLPGVLNPPALSYFSEVAQAGSFRQASHNLGIAASAIHRQIGLLEDQLGVKLFDRARGSSGVVLTPAGEALAYRSSRAMAEISHAINEIIDLSRARRGRVTIGATDAVAVDLLAPLIGEFRAGHPRIDFDIRLGEKPDLLSRHNELKLDLLVMYNMPASLDLRPVEEIRLRTFVVTRAGHPLAEGGRDSVSLLECVQYPMALASDPAIQDGILGRILAATGIRPQLALSSNSYVFMREALRFSDIIAIQGAFDGEFAHRQPDLCYIPLRETLGRFSAFTIAAPVNRPLSAAAELFLNSLSGALHRPG